MIYKTWAARDYGHNNVSMVAMGDNLDIAMRVLLEELQSGYVVEGWIEKIRDGVHTTFCNYDAEDAPELAKRLRERP